MSKNESEIVTLFFQLFFFLFRKWEFFSSFILNYRRSGKVTIYYNTTAPFCRAEECILLSLSRILECVYQKGKERERKNPFLNILILIFPPPPIPFPLRLCFSSIKTTLLLPL
uniref:Uncharacterized protein n=1 Tax=Cacopsylla melanoneura TaxID=428564 RepID=A0A8D9E7T7_9HEMI